MATLGKPHMLRILLALIATVAMDSLTVPAWSQFYGKETFEVSTAAEFIEAIGSERTIRLAAHPFVLSEVAPYQHPHVRWIPRGKAHSPVIRGVRNLRIIGTNDASELRATSGHSFILGIEYSQNIELRDLQIGSASAFNGGNLLSLNNCTNILLRSCQLSGAGSRALKLDRVARFVTRNSQFNGCTDDIMSVGRSANLLFRQTQFVGNRGRWGARFVDTYDVQFDRCKFSGNKFGDVTLSASSSAKIRVFGGEMSAPERALFTDAPKSVVLEKQKAD